MSRLVHAGSAVVDYVYRIDSLPLSGDEKVAGSFARLVGGGFNVMVAARRAGMDVAFAGRHGTGRDGDLLRSALAEEGISVLAPPSPDMDTGNCVVMVTDDAERTFVSFPGAESKTEPADLADIAVGPDDWVFVSGYTLSYPGSREALADWVEVLPAQTRLAFDPSPVIADIPPVILKRVLGRADWLSCNAAEATAIVCEADAPQAASRLLARHCRRAEGIVIRSGAAGAYLLMRDGVGAAVPGFAVEAVDTTGAGDTHIGACVAALAQGCAALDAVRYANAAAAISVTRAGGAAAPTHEEVLAFLAERDGHVDHRFEA